MANLEILAHEEVEGGAGVRANGADAAAAVSQEPQAEVGTQLRVLLEQQLWELPPRTKTGASQPLRVLDQKVPHGDPGRGTCPFCLRWPRTAGFGVKLESGPCCVTRGE